VTSHATNHIWKKELSGFMSRDEFFAALFILGCANGLGSRSIDAVRSSGWSEALLSTFGISVIVWIACFGGVRLIIQDKADRIRPADFAIAPALLALMALPIGQFSWLAVTILSLYVLLFTDPPSARQRGALILLATTVPMLWSRVLFNYISSFILKIDATLIGWLLGTRNVGNMVPFADKSGTLVIFPGCSSLANVSLALLAWVTISQWLPRRWSPKDLYWCLLAAIAVITVNVTRMSLMALSESHYYAFHSPAGDLVSSLLEVALIGGICFIGLKHESDSSV
jgi:hypothetical protein